MGREAHFNKAKTFQKKSKIPKKKFIAKGPKKIPKTSKKTKKQQRIQRRMEEKAENGMTDQIAKNATMDISR